MKTIIKKYILASISIAAAFLLAGTLGVSAEIRSTIDNPNKKTGGATTTQEAKIKNSGNNHLEAIQGQSDKLVEKHIDALTKLSDRVQAMKKATEQEKNAILNQIQTNIIQLAALRNSATTSAATTTPQNDKPSAKAYRSFGLVAPRGYIIASVDRINALAERMQGLSVKLASKIAQAKSAGNVATALEKSLADMNGQIAKAITLAADAKSLVTSLNPDDGDVAKAAQNRAAIASAREKIKLATGSLKTARIDANNIAQEIRKMGIKTSVGFGNATTTNAITTSATTTAATTTNSTTTTN